MGNDMTVKFQMGLSKEMGFTTTKMEIFTQVNGRRIRKMDLESSSIKIYKSNMKVVLKMVREVEEEFVFMKMEICKSMIT